MHGVTAVIAQYGTAIAIVSVFIVGYLAGNFERRSARSKAGVGDASRGVENAIGGSDPGGAGSFDSGGFGGFNAFNQEIMQDFARLKALEARARKAMYLYDCWCVSGKPESYPVEEEMAVEIGQAFMGALKEEKKGE